MNPEMLEIIQKSKELAALLDAYSEKYHTVSVYTCPGEPVGIHVMGTSVDMSGARRDYSEAHPEQIFHYKIVDGVKFTYISCDCDCDCDCDSGDDVCGACAGTGKVYRIERIKK